MVTKENPADILTKVLSGKQQLYLSQKLGMRSDQLGELLDPDEIVDEQGDEVDANMNVFEIDPVCPHCGELMWLDASVGGHRCLECEAAPANASASSTTFLPDVISASASSTTPVRDETCVVSELVGAFGSLSVSDTYCTLQGALLLEEPTSLSALPLRPPATRVLFERPRFLPTKPWHHKPMTDPQRHYLLGLAKQFGLSRAARHELVSSIRLRGEASAVIDKFLFELKHNSSVLGYLGEPS